jgi:hypothetical protein
MSVIEDLTQRVTQLEKVIELMIGKAKTDHNHVGMLHLENESMAFIISDAYVPLLRSHGTILDGILANIVEIKKKLNEVICYIANR